MTTIDPAGEGWRIGGPEDEPVVMVYVRGGGAPEIRIRVKGGDQPLSVADAKRVGAFLTTQAPRLVRKLRSGA